MSVIERSIGLYKAIDAMCRAGYEITLRREKKGRGTNSCSVHTIKAKHTSDTGHTTTKKLKGGSSYDAIINMAKQVLPDARDEAHGEISTEDLALACVECLGQIANYHGGERIIRVALSAKFQAEHRTIQQSFMSAIKLFIEDYVIHTQGQNGSKNNYDARNEAAARWASLVRSLNETEGHAGYPFQTI